MNLASTYSIKITLRRPQRTLGHRSVTGEYLKSDHHFLKPSSWELQCHSLALGLLLLILPGALSPFSLN